MSITIQQQKKHLLLLNRLHRTALKAELIPTPSKLSDDKVEKLFNEFFKKKDNYYIPKITSTILKIDEEEFKKLYKEPKKAMKKEVKPKEEVKKEESKKEEEKKEEKEKIIKRLNEIKENKSNINKKVYGIIESSQKENSDFGSLVKYNTYKRIGKYYLFYDKQAFLYAEDTIKFREALMKDLKYKRLQIISNDDQIKSILSKIDEEQKKEEVKPKEEDEKNKKDEIKNKYLENLKDKEKWDKLTDNEKFMELSFLRNFKIKYNHIKHVKEWEKKNDEEKKKKNEEKQKKEDEENIKFITNKKNWDSLESYKRIKYLYLEDKIDFNKYPHLKKWIDDREEEKKKKEDEEKKKEDEEKKRKEDRLKKIEENKKKREEEEKEEEGKEKPKKLDKYQKIQEKAKKMVKKNEIPNMIKRIEDFDEYYFKKDTTDQEREDIKESIDVFYRIYSKKGIKKVMDRFNELKKKIEEYEKKEEPKKDTGLELKTISRKDMYKSNGEPSGAGEKKEEPNIEERKKDLLIDLNKRMLSKADEIIDISSPYTFQNKKEYFIKDFQAIYIMISGIYKVDKEKLPDKLETLKDYPQLLRDAQKGSDFYPTPLTCIEPFKKIIEQSDNILEPTAGVGHIINQIRMINKKAQITAIEFSSWFADILRMFNPDISVNPDNSSNFLNYNPDSVNYDLILINPPFTKGTDSRYYMDFLFHCLYLMNRTKNIYNPNIIFISPDIIDNFRENKTYTLDNIISSKFLSSKKLLEICVRYGLNPSIKQIEYLKKGDEKAEEFKEEFEDLFNFVQGEYIGECSGFGGTKLTAKLNLISCYKRRDPVKKINFNSYESKTQSEETKRQKALREHLQDLKIIQYHKWDGTNYVKLKNLSVKQESDLKKKIEEYEKSKKK